MCGEMEWLPGGRKSIARKRGQGHRVQLKGTGSKQEWDTAQQAYKSQAKPAGRVGLGLERDASVAEPSVGTALSGCQDSCIIPSNPSCPSHSHSLCICH